MSISEACCTCATLLTDTKVPYDTESEKPIVLDHRLECCDRTICATCQYKNPRFQTYCPFCQISSAPSALPATGLRLPPSYSSSSQHGYRFQDDQPPAYESIARIPNTDPRPPKDTEDVVHFLSSDDSLASLSLAYRVPQRILRSHNSIYSDSLLAGRKWILVPNTHYQGPPLSTPPDPEEEERKNKLRRWMVATKCADYNVATLYLKGSDFNLEIAVEAFRADEQWEKEHPMKGKEKETSRRRRFGGTLSGQLS